MSSAFAEAAARNRRERRVPDADACESPGIERVLETGEYEHPEPAGRPAAEGVLLLDPRMDVTDETLRQLGERCAECGYRVRRARLHRDAGRLAELHYLPHVGISRTGTIDPWERVRLLAAYDRPEFREAFGCDAWEPAVLPAARVGLQEDEVSAWSRASTERRGIDSGEVDGPNRIGDCKFVNVLAGHGPPVFVLNAHLPEVIAAYGDCFAFHLEAHSPLALPWPRLRRELCGATDPARALPGTLRGDALAGLFPLHERGGGPVTRANNGLHLSNGAAEAARELKIWFDVRSELDALVERPCVDYLGRRRVVGELTDGLDAGGVRAVLRHGRLAPPQGGPVDPAALARADEAWELSTTLRDGALAVLARGLGFRDAELDLLVLREPGGEPEGRDAARLRHAVVLWDPHGHGRRLIEQAAAWRPSVEECERLLERGAVAEAVLSRSPLGYDGPRWALADLRAIGEGALADALAADDPRAVELAFARLRAA